MKQYPKDVYVDMTTAEGRPLSRNAIAQIAAIPDLQTDLDQKGSRFRDLSPSSPGSSGLIC